MTISSSESISSSVVRHSLPVSWVAGRKRMSTNTNVQVILLKKLFKGEVFDDSSKV